VESCAFLSGKPFAGRFVTGLRRPRWPILGSELAGEAEAAEPRATSIYRPCGKVNFR